MLEEGSLAIFYTDGLLEHSGVDDVSAGLDVLRTAAARLAYLPPEEICVRLLDAVIGDSDASDDIALLVLKAQPPRGGISGSAPPRAPSAASSFPPARDSVRRARRWLSSVAEPWGLVPTDVDNLLLATSELSTNALLHAGSEFRLEVTRHPDHVLVEISDSDPSLPQPRIAALERFRGGRGIAIVAPALARRFGVTPYEGGKRVWFEMATTEQR